MTYVIVTAIIQSEGKYLLLQRAASKKFAPGKWEFLSGFVDSKSSCEEILQQELKEEIHSEGKILKKGQPFTIEDEEGSWIIIPYIVQLSSTDITLNDHDHQAMQWLSIEQLESVSDIKSEFEKMKKQDLFL